MGQACAWTQDLGANLGYKKFACLAMWLLLGYSAAYIPSFARTEISVSTEVRKPFHRVEHDRGKWLVAPFVRLATSSLRVSAEKWA